MNIKNAPVMLRDGDLVGVKVCPPASCPPFLYLRKERPSVLKN